MKIFDVSEHIGLVVLSILLALALSACGSTYSQQRADEYDQFHRNTVETADRALDDKLTAIELRSHLESIDKARLAEQAARGSDVDLDAYREQYKAESDKAVADLFDGDNGRE